MARFKTRARTVDLLGRQQIAGIPTAISELFKNGHDAYAKHVEVDFFRSNRLFVLRDDGVGMTREDFETKWLVLGTESKVEQGGVASPYVPKGEEVRPVLGEKGIGRLAVAAIGPQVLVLSRAEREEGLCDLVASFIHWGIFEAPGLNLDQVVIPVRSFPGGTVPGRGAIRKLVEEFEEGMRQLHDGLDAQLRERIERDLASFEVDPSEVWRELPGSESLRLGGVGRGTHFYLLPAAEVLDDLLAEDRESPEAPPLVRMLIGFSNSMTAEESSPKIETAFRDHREPGSYTDRIARDEFFTPTEFANADHQFVGGFDEQGRFEGRVAVYGEERPHTVESPLKGLSRCGPFDFALAYVMGKPQESTLPNQEHAALIRKLGKIGGLYVYRDGVRILPYGDPKFDFLEFEERRSRGAAYYFFSYRRMFGAVTLTRERNSALREKAGREGFIEDRPYGDFRKLLHNFFVQVAADFFRKSAPDETYRRRRDELTREEKARREREKRVQAAREKVEIELAEAMAGIERDEPTARVGEVLAKLDTSIEAALESPDSVRAVSTAEEEARSALAGLRRRYRVQRPKDVGLPAKLLDDLDAYTHEYERLEEEKLRPAEAEIERIVTKAAQRAGATAENRAELSQPVEDLIGEETQRLEDQIAAVKRQTDDLRRAIGDFLKASEKEWTSARSEARHRLSQVDAASEEAAVLRSVLSRELRETADHETQLLEIVLSQLDAVSLSRDPDEGAFGITETLVAVESELYALRERETTDSELVQLGQALNIIDHELSDSVTSIRNGLRQLKAWVVANPDLGEAYDSVRMPFEHLDSQLKLFTPLRRRLYRSRVKFTGSQVAKFLRRLFERRLAEAEVRLEVSDAFERYEFFGFPSSVYPAFVNLLDNSLYWLRDRPQPRLVRLDVRDGVVLVSDTGPGVPDRDRERIFEPGFTRKRFGRGLGLAVARQALADTGYTLTLNTAHNGCGATFQIAPEPSTDDGNA